MKGCAHGIMFHHIQGDNDRTVQGVISRSQFHEIVKEVGLDNILPAKEWLDRAINNTLSETDVCLTFDDALRCQMEHALPMLQEYGLTAFWFVYTAACEGEGSLFEITASLSAMSLTISSSSSTNFAWPWKSSVPGCRLRSCCENFLRRAISLNIRFTH